MCFRFQQNGEGDYMTMDDLKLLLELIQKRQGTKAELEVISDYIGQNFGIEELPQNFAPSSNIALTDKAMVITSEKPRHAEVQRFSMIPFGTKDVKKIAPHFYGNATREKVASSPVWKSSLEKRRCLVPVSGFYDWITLEDGKTKIPYVAYVPGQTMFALAAIWDRWVNPDTNEEIRGFAIITSPPNELWSRVHDRMPVIVEKQNYEKWLDPQTQLKDVSSLLSIFPASNMEYREFTRSVNLAKNKNEHELFPTGQRVTI